VAGLLNLAIALDLAIAGLQAASADRVGFCRIIPSPDPDPHDRGPGTRSLRMIQQNPAQRCCRSQASLQFDTANAQESG